MRSSYEWRMHLLSRRDLHGTAKNGGPKKRPIWPVTLRDFSSFCIVPRGASGDSYPAVATFCLHWRREAVRVLMDCPCSSLLVQTASRQPAATHASRQASTPEIASNGQRYGRCSASGTGHTERRASMTSNPAWPRVAALDQCPRARAELGSASTTWSSSLSARLGRSSPS